MLGRKAVFNRQETLAAADEARARGKHKKAIAEYRRILEVDPRDFEVHGKIAPLLALAGDRAKAVESFRLCGEGHEQKGFGDRALSVYSQAVQLVPKQLDVWQRMARLHWERGRRADAVRVLWQGSGYFRRKADRAQAITLLQEAFNIDRAHAPLAIELAWLLRKQRRRDDAMRTLEACAAEAKGSARRKVRWAQMRMSPSPRTLWQWIRAWGS